MRNKKALNATPKTNTRDVTGKTASTLRGLLRKLCLHGKARFLVGANGEDKDIENRRYFAYAGHWRRIWGTVEGWKTETEQREYKSLRDLIKTKLRCPVQCVR